MNEIEAMHTAARRYCFDRWAAIVDDPAYYRDPAYHPDVAYSMYPYFWGLHRVILLESILADVESVLPEMFISPAAMREYLLLVGQTAIVSIETRWFPDPPPTPEEALDKERERYQFFIAGLTSSDLARVQPIPYRYRLNAAESTRMVDTLAQRWDTEKLHYWRPPAQLQSEIIALQADWFHVAVPDDAVRTALYTNGITRVWELPVCGTVREMDLAWLAFENRGAYYWTAGDMDWLIYASHEGSITIAGAWLVAAIKEIWPDWQAHIYTGGEYERPPTNW